MSYTLLVVGSLNMDLVVPVDHHPTPGETVLGSDLQMYAGGKGANQAVAAALAGGKVSLLGCLGEDDFGQRLQANLIAQGVNTAHLFTTGIPTGVALITVDRRGENMIVVSPGANHHLTPDRFSLDYLEGVGLVMLQLEIPLSTVEAVVKAAQARQIPLLLNPAPVQPLSATLLSQIDYLVLNESEAAFLGGQPVTSPATALQVAKRLRQLGSRTVIITLGGAGLVWQTSSDQGYLAAHPVEVVDTTAAGDSFCGAFAVSLLEGHPLHQALAFANAAAALTVTQKGSQPSLPHRQQIDDFLADPADY
ncbi:MAG: ribokinase [Cyanobacteriota bacterium]|nr:ribokinase [Cyanobacteriota bacterium]